MRSIEVSIECLLSAKECEFNKVEIFGVGTRQYRVPTDGKVYRLFNPQS